MTEETRKEMENAEDRNQASSKTPQKGTKKVYWIIAAAAVVLASVLGIVLYVQHLNSPEYILVKDGIWYDEITNAPVIVFFEDGTAKSEGDVFHWNITKDGYLNIVGNGANEKLYFYFEERELNYKYGSMLCLHLIDENGDEMILQSRFAALTEDYNPDDWRQ